MPVRNGERKTEWNCWEKFNSFQFWTVKFTVFLGHAQNYFFPEYLDCTQVQSAGPCSYQNMKVSAVQPVSLMYNVQTSMNDTGHLSR